MMNREILFRGKRVDNGEWEHGSLVIGRMGMSDESVYIADKMTVYHTPVTPETVGQYTGLTDRNGRKIFEGDIVKNVESGKTGRVSYIPEHGGFLIYCKSDNCYYWLYDNDFAKIEVIGNIHDNPEMLKGDQNV